MNKFYHLDIKGKDKSEPLVQRNVEVGQRG